MTTQTSPAQPAPTGRGRPTPFALRLVGGRALLVAHAQPLDALVPVPPGLLVQEVVLEVPGARFPLDASGGAERFQHHRLLARRLVLRVDAAALLAFVPPALGGVPTAETRLTAQDGVLTLEARLPQSAGASFVVVRASVVPAPPRGVELVLTDVRVVASGAPNALAVAESLLEPLGPGAPLVRRLDIARRVFTELMVASGWKVPDLSALRDVVVQPADGGLLLTFSADPLDAPALSSAHQERLVRALAASSLLQGWDASAPLQLLDKAAMHPHALALLAESMGTEGAARDEALAVIMDAVRRTPDSVELAVARARLLPRESTPWRRVAELARSQGDLPLLHAAALRWAQAVAAHDAEGSREGYQWASEARAESMDVAVGLAVQSAATGDWAEAVRAARRALEMPLRPADEQQAAITLARGRLNLKDFHGARRAVLRALRLGETAACLDILAQLDALEGRHSEAVRGFLRVAEMAGSAQARSAALVEAARTTQVALKDPAGALVLWQQALAHFQDPAVRTQAALCAWQAHDVELAAQWALGPQGQLPNEQDAARVAGLALWKLGGRDRDALRLLELSIAFGPEGTRSEAELALEQLRARAAAAATQAAASGAHTGVHTSPGAPVPWAPPAHGAPAREPPPPPVNTTPDQDLEEVMAAAETRVRVGPSSRPVPSIAIQAQPAPLEEDDLSSLDPWEDPGPPPKELSSLSELRPALLIALDADDAATVFLHAFDRINADRPALMEVARQYMRESPRQSMTLALELQRRGALDPADWRAISAAAAQAGDAATAVKALEPLVREMRSPEGEDILLYARALHAAGRVQEAVASLAWLQDLAAHADLVARAADVAMEFGEPTAALQMLEAAERGAGPALALGWARQAREIATQAGEWRAAVAAARRAARLGQAEDADHLEEALEAAEDHAGLADSLWERAYLELDADRAVRALRVECGPHGRGAWAALAPLERAVEHGAPLDGALGNGVLDVAATLTDLDARRRLLLLLMDSAQVPEALRLRAVAALDEAAPTPETRAWVDDEILRRWPTFAAALARTARRTADAQPDRASDAALRMEAVLQERGAAVGERLTWLMFAVEHGRRAGGKHACQAMERLLEFARREPSSARAAGVDRRALVMELAQRLEDAGELRDAVRVLSSAEALEGGPADRAQMFRKVARLEEATHPARAVEALERALRDDPADEDTAHQLERLLGVLDRHQELDALLSARLAQARGPARVALMLRRGDLLAQKLGRPADAAEQYRDALRAAPVTDAPLRRLLDLRPDAPAPVSVRALLMASRLRGRGQTVHLLQEAARGLAFAGRHRLAAAVWRAVVAQLPNLTEGWRWLAQWHSDGGRPQQTAQALEQLLAHSSDAASSVEARLQLVPLLASLEGRETDAVRHLKALLESGEGGPRTLQLAYELGARLGQAGLFEQGLRARAASAQQDQRLTVVMEGARVLIRLGALDSAFQWARVATAEHPRKPAAWNLLRDVAVLRDDAETQLEATRALVALLDETQPQMAAAEAEHAAELLARAGQRTLAAKALARALELHPDRPGLSYRLGLALLAAGDAPEAWSLLSRLKPDDNAVSQEAFARVLAQAATEAGVFESVGAWARVAALAPDDLEAWRRLASAAESVGAWAQATQAWERASALAHGEDRARILRRLARAAADASNHAVAARAMEEARGIAVGPTEELLRLARYQLAAHDAPRAAATLVEARDGGTDVPEEMVVEVATAAHGAGATDLAQKLVATLGVPRTAAAARLALELSSDAVPPRTRAELLEAVALDSQVRAEAARLWDRAARSWTALQDDARALAAARQALLAERSAAFADPVLRMAAAAGSWDAAKEALAHATDAAVSAACAAAASAGTLADIPEAMLTRWASQVPPPPAAVEEQLRRADDQSPQTRVDVLAAAVESSDRSTEPEAVVTGSAAARRLAATFAQRGDLEAARAWSLRIRAPGTQDLRQRMEWNLALERFPEALAGVVELLSQKDSGDAAALRALAVELARDRLEDPAAAVEHARALVDLRPDGRAESAQLVELLEETGALAEAAERVAAWAARSQGVEARALWRRALELAHGAGLKDLTRTAAEQVFALVGDAEAHALLLQALDAAADAAGAAKQAQQWWERTRAVADGWDAVVRLRRAGQGADAALLATRAFPQALGESEEAVLLQLLAEHQHDDALAHRLVLALERWPDSPAAQLRYLRLMPRRSARVQDVARVLEGLGLSTGDGTLLMHAVAARLNLGDPMGVPRLQQAGGRAGWTPDDMQQVAGALDPRALGPAAWPADASWLAGGSLPDDPGTMQQRPSWVLRQLEQVAILEDRPNLAAQALLERVARGARLSAEELRARAWLSDPDARPWLLDLVKLRPALGSAALDVVAAEGPGAVGAVAEAWARGAPSDEAAAAAWDAVARAAAEQLDAGAEFAALRQGQARQPNARRARRLLEAAQATDDVDAQLEQLETLARLDPGFSAHWCVARAQLLLDMRRPKEALGVLAAVAPDHTEAIHLRSRVYVDALRAGDAPLAQEALAQRAPADEVDALALAGLLGQAGRWDEAARWAEGRSGAAWDWWRWERASALGDTEEGHAALAARLADGSTLAARLLAAIPGSGTGERLTALGPLLRDGPADEALNTLRSLADDPETLDDAAVAGVMDALTAGGPAAAASVANVCGALSGRVAVDARVARWMAVASLRTGFPEPARAAWTLLSRGHGPLVLQALTVLADLAHRAGERDLEADALRRRLALEPRDVRSHLRLADLVAAPHRWMHLLAAGSSGGGVAPLLRTVAEEAREAGDAALAAQAELALAAARGQQALAVPPPTAEALAAFQGFPAEAFAAVQRGAEERGDGIMLARTLEAGLRGGLLPPDATHARLAQLWRHHRHMEPRALIHAEESARRTPSSKASAEAWMDLALAAGTPAQRADAMLHLAALTSGSEAVDLALGAAHVLEADLEAPQDALVVLARLEQVDARVVEMRVRLARMVGNAAEEARALEDAIRMARDPGQRLAAAWEAHRAWGAAGEGARALGVLIQEATRDRATADALLEEALQRNVPSVALAAVRSRWQRADRQEKRALVHQLLEKLPPSTQDKDLLDGCQDLAHMQVTADEEDGATTLWLARNAGHTRRFEAAAMYWRNLAALHTQGLLEGAVLDALLTQGAAVLARTGNLEDAEKLSRDRLRTVPEDRGAIEVLLAACRGRGDAEEVVEILSRIARSKDAEPTEKAFAWREMAEWWGNVLGEHSRAVDALLEGHRLKALAADEWAFLAAQSNACGRKDVEQYALARLVEMRPAEAARVALRRFDLMQAQGGNPADLALILQPVMQDPAQRLVAMERLVSAADTRSVASGLLPWLMAFSPPADPDAALDHWRLLARLAETAEDGNAAIQAQEALVALGEPNARAGVARALALAGRYSEAAQATLEFAATQPEGPGRVPWFRQAVAQFEAAGDSASADQARLSLLDADPSDVAAFDAVETRLRRQGRAVRLPELALRVAQAQQDPPGRARMFERAGFLLRDVSGDEAAAEQAFLGAVEADPFRARCLLALADLAFRRNTLAEAAGWFARVPDKGDTESDLGAVEISYRRGVCLEATQGDGRPALRRALGLDPDHHAARRALADAEQAHGNPAEAVALRTAAGDTPRPSEDPTGFAEWTLRQAEAMRQAGQHAQATELLERAQAELPSNALLTGGVAEALLDVDPVRAASLMRRASQLAPAGQPRIQWLVQESEAWRSADRPVERAQALAAAAQEPPQDPALWRQALEAAMDAEQDGLLVQLGNALSQVPEPVELPAQVHGALAAALQQDPKADGARILMHAEAALVAADSWGMRLKAVDGARRSRDMAALVRHVLGALPLATDSRMAASLAAEGARAALQNLGDAEHGAALLLTALEKSANDPRMVDRLGSMVEPPVRDAGMVESTVRRVLEAVDFPPALDWMRYVAEQHGDARRAEQCAQARALLEGAAPPLPEETDLPLEAQRALQPGRDAEWLLTGAFPFRMSKLVASMAREIHALVGPADLRTRSLSGDEARRLAPDIRFARSLVDGTLPLLVSDDQGVGLVGTGAPSLVLGRDVLRAPEPVRRAVMAVGFATVRWGLQPSLFLPQQDVAQLVLAMARVLDVTDVDLAPRGREWAAQLEKALRARSVEQSDAELELARTALGEGRLPLAEEARTLLARVAFMASGSLAACHVALDRVPWMDSRPAWAKPWGRALLRWVCVDEGLEARGRLGLEKVEV